MNTNENIVNNLKYLGLDLENVPNSIKEFVPLDYRPSKFNDEHNYKVYKYVNVEDIQDMVETGIMAMRGYEVAQKA